MAGLGAGIVVGAGLFVVLKLFAVSEFKSLSGGTLFQACVAIGLVGGLVYGILRFWILHLYYQVTILHYLYWGGILGFVFGCIVAFVSGANMIAAIGISVLAFCLVLGLIGWRKSKEHPGHIADT